jgi:hypothetical protein
MYYDAVIWTILRPGSEARKTAFCRPTRRIRGGMLYALTSLDMLGKA